MEGASAATVAYAAMAVSTVASVAVSIDAQQKARKDQKKAADRQDAANEARRQAEMRQQFRQERIRRADILQQSQNTGVTGSSGEAGALSSLATQLSSNMGYNTAMNQNAKAISNLQQSAADHMGTANTAEGIGRAANSIFAAYGSFK